MKDRDSQYLLAGAVELDDAYIGFQNKEVSAVGEPVKQRLWLSYHLIKKVMQFSPDPCLLMERILEQQFLWVNQKN